MSKFGENSPTENAEEDVENTSERVSESSENVMESPESISEMVSESSQETIDDADHLLQSVSEGMDVEEVEGGPGLLETAKNKLMGVGDRIQDLASSTRQKIKEAVVGVDVKDMTDQELAEHIKGKREEVQEANQHNKDVRIGGKFDLGGFRAQYAQHKLGEKLKEKNQATREAKKRGIEVLTEEEERSKEISEINSTYIRLKREIREEHPKKQRREEIDSMLADLEAKASSIDYEIPSDITGKYSPEEIAQQEAEAERERRAMEERISQEEEKERKLYNMAEEAREERKRQNKAAEIRDSREKNKAQQEHDSDYYLRYGKGGQSGAGANSPLPDHDGKPLRF